MTALAPVAFGLACLFPLSLEAAAFRTQPVSIARSASPWLVAAGDVDGDGTVELVGVNPFYGPVSVLRRQPGGTFVPEFVPTTLKRPSAIALGDLDADGLPELVLGGRAGGVAVLGNDHGTFREIGVFRAGFPVSAISVGDVDGNGTADVLAMSADAGVVRLLAGSGLGSLLPAVDIAGSKGARAAALADLNGDGNLDIAIARPAGVIDLLFGERAPDPTGGSGDVAVWRRVTIRASASPRALIAQDIDGDTDADLLVAGGPLMVLTNAGDGTFTRGTPLPFAGARSLAVTDLVGDGALEIALVATRDEALHIMRIGPKGAITEEPGGPWLVGHAPWSLATGDFDGDGRGDVAVAQRSAKQVSLLLNETPSPIVETGPPQSVGPATALVAGTASANGYPTEAWFEYGLTTDYGARTASQDLSGTTSVAIAALLVELAPNRLYHYRLVARNDQGVSYGIDQIFTTTVPGPVSITPPSIAGLSEAGSMLRCDPGEWSGGPRFDFSWLRDAGLLVDATTSFLATTPADAGHPIRCRVTASNGGGSASADSADVVLVSPPVVPVRCVVPKVRGFRTRVARRLIVRAGCRVGKVQAVRVKNARLRGRVVGTRPKAGRVLPYRARVRIIVGRP